MRVEAPCRDCENRQVGCHSTCDTYKEFKKLNDEDRNLRHKLNAEASNVYRASAEGRKRMKTRRASNRK